MRPLKFPNATLARNSRVRSQLQFGFLWNWKANSTSISFVSFCLTPQRTIMVYSKTHLWTTFSALTHELGKYCYICSILSIVMSSLLSHNLNSPWMHNHWLSLMNTAAFSDLGGDERVPVAHTLVITHKHRRKHRSRSICTSTLSILFTRYCKCVSVQ